MPWRKYKKATKLLPKIRHLKYADRLKTCKLPTMHYRRIRGDMIETETARLADRIIGLLGFGRLSLICFFDS